jgi:hypothetical protein
MPKLQHDDTAPARLATSRERWENVTTSQRIVHKGCWGCLECSSISWRVRNKQDDVIDAAVPSFQSETPLEGLRVIDHGLRFDARPPTGSSRNTVPGPSIAGNRKWYFGAPTKAGVEPAPEPLEQACMPCVPDRVAFRVWTGRDDETEGGCEQDERPKRHVGRPPSFDATDLRVGDARCGLERPLADSGADSGTPELPSERAQSLVGQPVGSIVSSLARRHQRRSWTPMLAYGFTRSCQLLCGSPTTPEPHGVPNVEGPMRPTTARPLSARLSRRLARPTDQRASDGAVRRRLARPTDQRASDGAVRRRLARPTDQRAWAAGR